MNSWVRLCAQYVVGSVIATSAYTFAQTAPQSTSANDPEAVTLANAALTALTGGTTIQDVTLTGNVVSGADSGTATLKAMPSGESRIDLALSEGTRTEVRDAQTGLPLGRWINPDNSFGDFSFQNCWTDAAWFFPALGVLGGDPSQVLSYVGLETRNGANVQHLQTYISSATQPYVPSVQQLSSEDIYLDAITMLPVAITYNTHPDNDASVNIPIEIDFSSYQAIGGVSVPSHIQRYQQGNLIVDLTITGAEFNTGLSLSSFAIQ